MTRSGKLRASLLVGAAGLALVMAAFAYAGWQAGEENTPLVPYTLLTTISVQGDLAGGFDISWVDSQAGMYYLADRGNVGIDVIDTKALTFEGVIPLHAAPNGVLSISGDDGHAGELWVGDRASNVEVVDLASKTVVDEISTGGTMRADELAYDPVDQEIMVANDNDTPPFVTFISTRTHKVLGKLLYPQATNGLEQPLWYPQTKRFFFAVPATTDNPKGEIDDINPANQKVVRILPTSCNPAGLVVVPGRRLVTSCGDIVSATSGKITNVKNVGGDEAWFNSADGNVYVGGGATRIVVPVIDTEEDELATTLTVGNLSVTPTHTTHSVAADSQTNRIFVPVTHEGVKVYSGGQ